MPQTSSGLGLDSEFPPFLPNFNGLKIVPDKLKVEAKKWNATITLTNTTDCGVLYKVIVRSIADPKPKDQLNVVFVLVGKQWLAIDNAYKCWRRVKGYTMPTRNKLIEVQVD
ncbi:hypothetical protein WR25_07646 [Diploscapter pachys]|uniref:Major sperm protein n=1 Tax=Diploscapter pachys TaxID=2018661 RepID=A0A2A2LV19_9BILA|nr:hypothetical protein WR25_07646 [Diploscapter pachys]